MIGALLAPFAAIFVLGLGSFLIKSLERPSEPSERGIALQIRLRSIGIALFALGLLCGLLVGRSATPVDAAATAFASSRYSDHEAIVIGGKAAVYATHIREWFAGLWHGRMLALMIVLLSGLVCFACFFLAHPLLISTAEGPSFSPANRRKARPRDPHRPDPLLRKGGAANPQTSCRGSPNRYLAGKK